MLTYSDIKDRLLAGGLRNWSTICEDLNRELGPVEYGALLHKHLGKPTLIPAFAQAWCDLGDEGWVVE